jgi:hypothetical protein
LQLGSTGTMRYSTLAFVLTSHRLQAQALPLLEGTLCKSAVVHVLPPSLLTSTRMMSRPPPLHAYPLAAQVNSM